MVVTSWQARAPNHPDVNSAGLPGLSEKSFWPGHRLLGNATAMSPEKVQALTLLGRLRLQQEGYGRAASNVEKAVLVDADYWEAHDLLATSYLKNNNTGGPGTNAELALIKSKGNSLRRSVRN